MSQLQTNLTNLQEILDKINNLPENGGEVELPELSNPATAAEVFANKELIDSKGNVITGTFTIENELTVQDDLISHIQAAVDSLPDAGEGGSSSSSNETYTLELNGYEGDDIPITLVYYYSNGKLCTYSTDGMEVSQITINNIDVDTLVVIPHWHSFDILDGSVTTLESEEIIFYSSEANSHVILEIY